MLRVRGRSFLAISLAPTRPLPEWLEEIDRQAARAPGFFAARPVVLDLTGCPPDDPDLPNLVPALRARGLRIVGVEGIAGPPDGVEMWSWPPVLGGGRPGGVIEVPEGPMTQAEPAASAAPEGPTSLVLDKPVRSGQSVLFPAGDVTVLGAVASGAEVIAGGSIHVYGALRGRAIAGFAANPGARIFCRRMEAELLAIDGLYRTAEDLPAELRGRPAQAWLEGDVLQVGALG